MPILSISSFDNKPPCMTISRDFSSVFKMDLAHSRSVRMFSNCGQWVTMIDERSPKRVITTDTALHPGRFFKMSVQFCLNLQAHYNLAIMEDRLGRRLEPEVKMLAVAFKSNGWHGRIYQLTAFLRLTDNGLTVFEPSGNRQPTLTSIPAKAPSSGSENPSSGKMENFWEYAHHKPEATHPV